MCDGPLLNTGSDFRSRSQQHLAIKARRLSFFFLSLGSSILSPFPSVGFSHFFTGTYKIVVCIDVLEQCKGILPLAFPPSLPPSLALISLYTPRGNQSQAHSAATSSSSSPSLPPSPCSSQMHTCPYMPLFLPIIEQQSSFLLFLFQKVYKFNQM